MTTAYLRISTPRQVLDNQRNEIEKYVQQQNIKVDLWVTEVVSGKKKQSCRKLGRLLESLKKGDTMIVTEVSRLSRTLTEVMAIMGKCVEMGIILHCIKEHYTFDDTINSKVLCFAFGLVAEIERNLISLRTKEALALRRANGRELGREKGRYPKLEILKEHHNEILKLLYDGETIDTVCRKFNVCKETFRKYQRQENEINTLIRNRWMERLKMAEISSPSFP